MYDLLKSVLCTACDYSRNEVINLISDAEKKNKICDLYIIAKAKLELEAVKNVQQ